MFAERSGSRCSNGKSEAIMREKCCFQRACCVSNVRRFVTSNEGRNVIVSGKYSKGLKNVRVILEVIVCTVGD